MTFDPLPPVGLKTVEEARERAAELSVEPAVWMALHLRIRDKRKQIVPLECNEAQAKLEALIRSIQADGRPVRIIVLKARQVGISTWVCGRYYQTCVTGPNTRALIAAHDVDSTAQIFEKAKLMHDLSALSCKLKHSNKKELVFAAPVRSEMAVQTAGKVQVGRGQTINLLHGSEVAFWPEAAKTLNGLLQAVPDEPNSIVVLESTANGVGGAFHEMWEMANDPASGSGWAAFFFGWHEDPDNRRKPPADFEPDEAEKALAETYKLDRWQLYWRRWTIKNKCGGKEEIFKQEYPSCPAEAFLATGHSVFNLDELQKALSFAASQAPPAVGELVEDGVTGEIRFVESPGGRLKIWRKPHPKGQYAMGADCAEGVPGGDLSGTVVLHKRALTEVARLHGYIPPDEHARETHKLQRWYNNAPVCPDATAIGQAFINEFKGLSGRIYRKRVKNKLTNEIREELGYKFDSAAARALLVQPYVAAVRAGEIGLRDRDGIREHMTFVYKPIGKSEDVFGKAEHQTGCRDDRVFENLLAYEMIRMEPWRPKRPRTNVPRRIRRGASVPGIRR